MPGPHVPAGRHIRGALLALLPTLALAACSPGHGVARTDWSTDWRHDPLVIATADGRRPLLWGVDPVTETVEPLTRLPAGGDLRLDSSAHALPLDAARTLVTVPAARASHQTAYVVDRTSATVARRADLPGALYLDRVPGGYVAVRVATGRPVLVRLDQGLRQVATRPLPFAPAYAALDQGRPRALCLVASGGGRARVAVVDAATGRDSVSGGAVAGDVSAIACGSGRSYVGVVGARGARSGAEGGGFDGRVLRTAGWDAATTLVSVPGGQVQSLAVDRASGHLVVGAAAGGVHEVIELDPRRGGLVIRRTALPGVEAVSTVVVTPASLVVLAVDRVAFVNRSTGAVRTRELPSPLLSLQASAS